MVTILPCQTKRLLKLFEQVPELVHNNDPYFVPAFPGSVVKMFGKNSAFLKAHGELFPFLAMREGKIVGRISACINRSHNEYYNDKVGFFGFFDFINDVEVAEALLVAAQGCLRERGFNRLRGPYNPTINEECGVLTEGFDSAPFVMMNYNPPYYLEIYDKLGLLSARNLSAFYFSATTQPPERIEKIVNRVKKSTGVSVRIVDMKNLDRDLAIIQELYNATLNRNWGFVPITFEDLKSTADDLKQIADPEMIMIAEREGVPMGFSLVLPNINEFMLRAKSSRGLLRLLRLAWYVKTSRPKEARLTILGVLSEYRNLGLAVLFYYETLARGRKTYIGAELSWVDEDNKEITHAITVMGGKRYKAYRIYEKELQS